MVDLRRIAIERIRHRPDARRRDEAALTALEESIAVNGLLQPILCRPLGDDEFEVVAGSHRLQAVQLLEWPDIDAIVLNLDDLKAEMAMIDENLVRAELTPAERAKATARAKELHLLLHPETAHGGSRFDSEAASRQLGDLEKCSEIKALSINSASTGSTSRTDIDSGTVRFTADCALKTGRPERSIQRDAERGDKIEPGVLAAIAGTKLDTGRGLDEIKTVPKSEQAAYVKRRLAGAQQRPQGGLGARHQAPISSTPIDCALFERFLKAADWFDGLSTSAPMASAGRQRAVACQRAAGIIQKLDEMIEGAGR